MILLTIKEEDKAIIKSYHECPDLQVTQSENEIIFSLNRRNDNNIPIIINGDTPIRIFLMNNSGRTIDRYYWKVK